MGNAEFTPEHIQAEVERIQPILAEHGIDTSTWRIEDAKKTVHHLAQEILEQDSSLVVEDGQLLRLVSPVNVHVYAEVNGVRYKLHEDRQVFHTGNKAERRRGLDYLAEKMRDGEKLEDAFERALREEISVEPIAPIIPLSSRSVLQDSSSFPGLAGRYNFYAAETTIPEEQYNPDGYIEVQKDKTTYFVWKIAE